MGKNEINLAGNLINIINTARENALKKVNEELISMYWQVGEYLHEESQRSSFGDSYIDSVAKEIQEEFPGIKGFNRRGLYRMKQFYETYAENDVVTPLVTQISWTNHLLIMSGCKSDEEREFYIRLCIKEKYSKRQLQRQLDSGYYERYMLSKDVLLPESVKRLGENPFLDSYVMEFLDLPNEYHENDLRKALIRNMKDFILELGKDFTFIDEEYKVQVGGDDFRISKIFSILQLEVFKNFEWNDFKNWVTESLLKPLNLKEIEEYVSYQRDMDCFDELLSASAYVSNRCKYGMKKANTKEEIEDAFRNSKLLFVDDSYDAGNAVLYLAMDIDNKIVFSFTSRCIFVNWFKYIPITFTDRNYYKSIIDKEPLFANVPALIDLADMNPNTINFIYDINVTEYYQSLMYLYWKKDILLICNVSWIGGMILFL